LEKNVLNEYASQLQIPAKSQEVWVMTKCDLFDKQKLAGIHHKIDMDVAN